MDSGIENTEQAYQRSLMEGDMLLTELPSEQSFLQMKEEMKENWWKGKEETPVEQTQMDTPKIKTEPQKGISEASYPVEQDIGTPLSGAMSDIAVRDNVKLREMGIVPATDWTKEGPITSPRTTLPSDRTFVSVEDIFMDTMRQDDNNMFDGMNQLVENQGFSKFEQEIAMSENPEYFKGDESKATYMDIDTKTGKNRPAEGYGVARGKQPKTRAQHNQALKSHIHESKKSARKTVGNKIWNKLPTEKQEVLTELIYQMGPNRIQEFPRFLGAMVRGNYELAAQELLYTKEGKPSDWSQKGGKARVRRIVKKLDPLIKFEDEKLPIYAMGEQ
jgi:GH24 family phage-related lysozyme (muramidase)